MLLKKIIFQNRYVELETPPPLHGKNHLKFPFDYWNPCLRLLSRWICQNWYMEFSMLLCGFVEIDKWICWCCYMDFSKLFHVFRVLYQAKPSWRLTQICWSFCLELKVLHGTKYSMPFTMFFLKIFPQKYGGYNTYISTSVQKEYDWYRD